MTMDTKALLAEAEALKPQLLTDRRTLHRDPEVGPSLPHTAAYVTERLTALGYTPRSLAGAWWRTSLVRTPAGACCSGRIWTLSGSGRPRDWIFSRKTAPCTPAATICTPPCC